MRSIPSVDALVRESVRRFASKTLLISAEDGRRFTFRQLDGLVSRAANVLSGLGIRKGDTVSLFLRNSPEFFPPWLGTVRLGACVNPINLGLENNVERVEYMLKKARARVFVLEKQFAGLADTIRTRIPALRVVLVDHPAGSDLDWAKALNAASENVMEVPVSPDDSFQMIFTSGTTGLPKAVVQHHSMLEDSFCLAEHFGFAENDVLMCVLPLFHVNAQYTSFFPALGLGGTLVLFEKFSASRFFTVAREHRVNAISVVPSLLTRLLAHGLPPERPIAPTLRFIVCGAAPLTSDLHKDFVGRSGIPVPNGWGMTETGCWGCHSDPARPVWGAMGRPLTINEMRVVEPATGKELPRGEVGRLLIRGRNIFRQYFDAPEANREAFRYGDGWFDTGDDVRQDDDGYFYFIGRGSVDTGKVDGEFVNYLSIDEKLWSHPKVSEVCCVGVPDAIRGNVVAACIVPKPGEKPTAEEILEFCKRQGLAKWELPRHVLIVTEIPKGDTGKIQRRVMAERAAGLVQRSSGR